MYLIKIHGLLCKYVADFISIVCIYGYCRFLHLYKYNNFVILPITIKHLFNRCCCRFFFASIFSCIFTFLHICFSTYKKALLHVGLFYISFFGITFYFLSTIDICIYLYLRIVFFLFYLLFAILHIYIILYT